MTKITVEGIDVLVTKKNIRNMYLSVRPPNGIVKLSIPHSVDDETIKRFIMSKLSWINKHKETFNKVSQSKKEYVDGEIILLFGKSYNLKVKYNSKANSVKIEGDNIYLYVREKSTIEQRERVINEWHRKLLKEEVPKLISKWEEKMDVKSESWHIKNMKTRWGTCNVNKKRIWINLQLAKKPLPCLEYIVVHELTHLLESSHNKVFISYMDKFLPDWRMRKKQLNNFKD